VATEFLTAEQKLRHEQAERHLKDFRELNGNLDAISEPKCYVGGTFKLTASGAQVVPVSPTHDGPCTWQEGQVGCCHGYRGCDPNLALLESRLAGMKIEMQYIKDGPATPMVKVEMLGRGDKVVAELEKNIAAMKSREIKPTGCLKDFEELNLDLMSEPKCYKGGDVVTRQADFGPVRWGGKDWYAAKNGSVWAFDLHGPVPPCVEYKFRTEVSGLFVGNGLLVLDGTQPREIYEYGGCLLARELAKAQIDALRPKPTTVLGAECDKPEATTYGVPDSIAKSGKNHSFFRKPTAEAANQPPPGFSTIAGIDPTPQKLLTSNVEPGFRPFGAGVSARILTPAQLNDCCDFARFPLPELVKLRDKLNELIYDKERQQ
jgi:hypothetical protein